MGDMIRCKRIYNDVISAYIIRYINEKRREVKLLSILVPRPGIEPGWIAPLVFETSASTDSAIWASLETLFVSRLRLQRYDIFFNLQIFCYFFLTFSAFFSQPYFGLFCIDFMAQSELQHSHGLLLFFMRLKY